ncbi:hypothetical protein U9M48_012723 [Paspalum notatum var. saurae]|uniref:Ubiquitin-like protease family profile domain-containing protein n=1 Tax=Paspalum notatum var. saurae TaxID=547442 RepID=A0AAQ3SY39_PASNO
MGERRGGGVGERRRRVGEPDRRWGGGAARWRCGGAMTSVDFASKGGVSIKDEFDDDALDEAVFELFKKEAVSTLGCCIDEHATTDFRSSHESGFGKFLNDEQRVISLKKPTHPKTEKNACGRILSFDRDSSKGATPVAELNVQFVKEINLVDKLKEMCNTSDKLYNESFVSRKDVNPCASTVLEDPGIADKKKVSPYMSFVTDDGVRNADKSDRFPITAEGRRLYNVVCTLASNSRSSKNVAVDIGGCNLKYFSLGDSMAIGHRIVFMSNPDDYSYVGRCFNGAASVLPLSLCEMIANFRHTWGLFVGSRPDFDGFRVAYPRVPNQTNIVDCGVFVIKFMELWKFECNLFEELSQKDIPNIRIQIVNDLLMSDHNKANIDVVRNYYG